MPNRNRIYRAPLLVLIAFCLMQAGAAFAQVPLGTIEASPLAPSEFDAVHRGTTGVPLILRTGVFDPTRTRLTTSALDLDEPEPGFGIVQFEPGSSDAAARLRTAGIEPIAYQPRDAWLVRWSPRLKQTAARLDGVRFSGDFSAVMKLAPELLTPGQLPTRRARLADGALSELGVTLEILGFPGTDASALAAAAVKFEPTAHVVEVRRNPRWPVAVVWLPHTRVAPTLERLTGVTGVYQLGEAVPVELHNTDSVEPIQANTDSGTPLPSVTPIWDQGLIGSGQIVAVMDSGLDRNEDWFVALDDGSGPNVTLTDDESPVPPATGTTFPDRKVYGYWVQPGATAYDNNQSCNGAPPIGFHGTHVVGTVAGDRLGRSTPTDAGYDDGDGMAPNAQILFQDIGNDSSGCLSITDFGGSLRQAVAGGAAIHSNSWGGSVNGVYNSNSAELDAATWAEESLLVTVSAGNDGPGTDTIGAPATAKNALTVGALSHGNSTTVASFSSRGPTDDGRIKPDIQAPGSSIRSAAGDTNNGPAIEPGSIRFNSGTSMSNPAVAGGAALLRQYFVDGFYPSGARTAADSDRPSGALMKAALLNGTRADAGFNIPANDYGWGRIWLDNNLFFGGDPRYIRHWDFSHETGLATGDEHVFDLAVLPGQELRATLVWFDVAGAVGSGVTLVNDLDLEVTAPGGSIFRGNVFASGSQSTNGGVFDRLNTVEQVLLPTPAAGQYQFRVIGHAVPGNGEAFSNRQGYALVVSAASPSASLLNAPASVTATDQGMTGIQVDIDPVVAAAGYNVYRASGDCTSQDLDFNLVGHTSSTSFVDGLAIGGFTYSYRVRAEDGASEGPVSNCTSASVATSTGECELPPEFNQSSVTVADASGDVCGIDLAWDAGSARCPLGSALRYNVYRSTDPFFTPGPGNLLAGDVEATSFADASPLPDTTYFYVVRAEDSTDPVDGNESNGEIRVQAASFASGNVAGTFSDSVEGLSLMQPASIWSISDNRSASGALSYRSASNDAATYTPNTCATLTSPPIELQAGNPQLSFQASYDVEFQWDGVVVEISTNDGASWTPLTPDGGYPSDFSQTQNPPLNVCGYPASQGAFNGSTGGAFDNVDIDLGGFAGQTVRVRWVLSTDPGAEEEGFYLDDVEITDASMPAMCLLEELFSNGFESP